MREQRGVDLMKEKLPDLPLLAAPILLCGLYFLFFCFFMVEPTYAAIWGNANIGVYPLKSSIVAPNGLVYNPLAHIGLDLNIGNDNIYVFDENVLFLERPTPGVTTNSSQGSFDFTKREMDFKIGLAAKPFDNKHFEFRLWGISLNNLNRGNDPNTPSGFKDGVASEARYYFSGEKVWGYLAGGYYFTKTLVAPNGQPFKPGIFVGGNLNYNLLELPQKLYAFTDIMVINLFGRVDGGLAYRPLKSLPDTEVRLSGSRYLDFNEKSPGETTFLFEIRHYFRTGKASNIQPDYTNIQSVPISKEGTGYKPSTERIATMLSTQPVAIKPSTEPMATDVWFDSRMMYVHLLDGREIGVPLAWFPKLRDAQDGQRKRWRLTDSGTGMHWEDLDEDISVAELLKR
jgi:hypothetical protein